MEPVVLGNCTLYRGDCLDIMPTVPGPVDAIITDMPYGTTACKWDSVIPFAPMWTQVKRLLKKRGAFVTTASQPFTSALIMSNLAWFKFAFVWDKVMTSGMGVLKYQPFKTHEDIIVFSPGVCTYNPQITGVASKPFSAPNGLSTSVTNGNFDPCKARSGVGYPKSILRFPRPNNLSGGGLHPTQKPVALYEYLIRTYTNAGELVVDFCMGSGTTGVAAVKTGRNFIGIEKDAGYFEIAVNRITAAQAQLRLL